MLFSNSSHSSIDMAPFEEYERGYRSLIGWFEVGDVKRLGFDLVKMLKIRLVVFKERS